MALSNTKTTIENNLIFSQTHDVHQKTNKLITTKENQRNSLSINEDNMKLLTSRLIVTAMQSKENKRDSGIWDLSYFCGLVLFHFNYRIIIH